MTSRPGRPTDDGMSRRDLLLGRLRKKTSDEPPRTTTVVHRPPGAVDEAAFLADCTRCGDCITACPPDAIVLAPEKYGAAAGTPIINPMTSPCVMCDDPPCIHACEPGVLSFAMPLKMGTASIRDPYCLAHQGTSCTVCSEQCPVEGALAVVNGKPVINDAACTGCGVCQYVCPAPYNAVLILPVDRGPKDTPPPVVSPHSFDWRKAYLGDRGLAPPSERTGGTVDGA